MNQYLCPKNIFFLLNIFVFFPLNISCFITNMYQVFTMEVRTLQFFELPFQNNKNDHD